MTVLTEKTERVSPYMFTASENWSRRGVQRSRLSSRIRYVLASAACLMIFLASPGASYAQVPTYEVTPEESSIKFGVDSSVSIKGIFEKWNASIKFSSRDVRSAVLDIEFKANGANPEGNGREKNERGRFFLTPKHA